MNIVIIIILCVLLYAGYLYFGKDPNLNMILDKTIGKILKKGDKNE